MVAIIRSLPPFDRISTYDEMVLKEYGVIAKIPIGATFGENSMLGLLNDETSKPKLTNASLFAGLDTIRCIEFKTDANLTIQRIFFRYWECINSDAKNVSLPCIML